jgi:hypothetical protein
LIDAQIYKAPDQVVASTSKTLKKFLKQRLRKFSSANFEITQILRFHDFTPVATKGNHSDSLLKKLAISKNEYSFL